MCAEIQGGPFDQKTRSADQFPVNNVNVTD